MAAGNLPESLIRDLLSRTSITAIVGEVVALKRAGNSLMGLCPFHGEKTPSFHVSEQRGSYYCFGCHEGGDAIGFVRKIYGLSFREAIERLAVSAGIELPADEVSPEDAARRAAAKSRRARYAEVMELALGYFRSRMRYPEARQYLAKRGLDEGSVERFRLGAADNGWDGLYQFMRARKVNDEELEALGLCAPRRGDLGGFYDRFRERLMYPIHNTGGTLVAFGGRTLQTGGDAPKYINSPESPLYKKGDVVFGLHLARSAVRRLNQCVIVEGNLDVITLVQAGIDNVCAPMGTALTDKQLGEIKRFTNNVVLVFDGDNAGRNAAAKAVHLALESGLEGRVVALPDGEDPDSFVRAHGAAAFRTATLGGTPLLEAFLDACAAPYKRDRNISSLPRVFDEAAPLLDSLGRAVLWDQGRQHLAATLGLAGDEVERYLHESLEARGHKPSRDKVRAEPPSYHATAALHAPRAPRQDRPSSVPAGDDDVSDLERDLVRLLFAEPTLLVRFVNDRTFDSLQHHGLKRLLAKLAKRTEDALEEDPGALPRIPGWLEEEPPSAEQRACMRACYESEHVPTQDLGGTTRRGSAS